MNDIDFIKKCCEYADGHHVKDGYYPDGYWLCYKEFSSIRTDDKVFKDSPEYRDLIQRAIEGMNNISDNWIIEQHPDGIELYTNGNGKEDDFFSEDIDTAKRAALEYIFNKEELS
jgi:hypothetical protein